MTLHIKANKAQFREAGTREWLTAQVPGSVHTDLMALGRIPDPFASDNELRVQWVAERDWEYKLTFYVPAALIAEEKCFLSCEGLDTLSTITLNGQVLGSTDNMFRCYSWDVTSLVTEKENEVHILFSSTVGYMREKQAEQPLIGPTTGIPGGPHVRKAICQFGWDWGPQLPPTGVWKEIQIQGYSIARFDDIHLRQQHTNDTVTISADLMLERWKDADLKAVLSLVAPDGHTQETEYQLAGAGTACRLEIKVTNPQYWWPNGYGEQPRYKVNVMLYESTALLDQRSFQIGLRTLDLRQETDAFGTSFTFVVNNVPVFAKGANWIPADSFPTRISDDQLEHLIRSAAEVHMNMLRVWGGGFYEEDRFYDLCDKYGLLVWQDFTFSCAIYPAEQAFFENVRAEAVDNIRRLRHHPSLVLWCGNNEMEWGWESWGWDRPEHQALKAAYERMFHHFLPKICRMEDPDRPYWPSSPSSNTVFILPNGVRAGDTHNWEVWHGNRPFHAYREHHSRFVSEFGFQSLPPLKTIRTYASETDRNMTSYIMEHHQRNAAGNGKIIKYMSDHFRMPKDFESLVYLSQVLQAEAVRTGVEFWRRSHGCTSGTLYWQLNDCWPVASWSSLDYFGRWKALHYAARRFYAPVLLSAEDSSPDVGPIPINDTGDDERRIVRWSVEKLDGNILSTGEAVMGTKAIENLFGTASHTPHLWKPLATLYVTNDLTQTWQGSVHWSLETLDGQSLASGEEPIAIPALTAQHVRTLDFSNVLNIANRCEVILVYELWCDRERISMSVMPFVPSKHLKLLPPGLETRVMDKENHFEIELSAQHLARFVWLALADVDVHFDDNYFDIPAGCTVKVHIPKLAGWTTADVQAALQVRSLADSF